MKSRRVYIAIILLGLSGAFYGCSQSPGDGNAGVPIRMEISFKSSLLTQFISAAELQIVYPSGDTLFEIPQVTDTFITDTLVLPVGTGVEFYLTAISPDGIILYAGRDTIDILPGGQVVADIVLQPAIAFVTFRGFISCSPTPGASPKPALSATIIDSTELSIVYPESTIVVHPGVSAVGVVTVLLLPPAETVEFNLRTFTSGGDLLYQGAGTFEIVPGIMDAEICLTAMLPVLGPHPSYQEISLTAGDSASVGIELSEVTDLFGASFRLVYDTTKLKLAKVTAGDLLGEDVLFFYHAVDDYLAVSITLLRGGAVQAVSGSGRLVTVVFVGRGVGTSPLQFDNERASFVDSAGQPVPESSQIQFETGEIKVVP